jgi:hypothetical protein
LCGCEIHFWLMSQRYLYLCEKKNNSLSCDRSFKDKFLGVVFLSFGFMLPLNILSLLMKQYQCCCHFILCISAWQAFQQWLSQKWNTEADCVPLRKWVCAKQPSNPALTYLLAKCKLSHHTDTCQNWLDCD